MEKTEKTEISSKWSLGRVARGCRGDTHQTRTHETGAGRYYVPARMHFELLCGVFLVRATAQSWGDLQILRRAFRCTRRDYTTPKMLVQSVQQQESLPTSKIEKSAKHVRRMCVLEFLIEWGTSRVKSNRICMYIPFGLCYFQVHSPNDPPLTTPCQV